MSKLFLFALLVSCSLFFLGCFGGGAGRFTASSGWAAPVVSEKVLYVGTRDGRVLALDIRNKGSFLRSYPSIEEDPLSGIYGTPVLDDGTLFVSGYNGKLYALDAESLDKNWEFPKEGDPFIGSLVGGPVIADGLVVFGSSDGYVRAVRVANGELVWGFRTDNKIWSTPIVEGNTVYVSSLDHRLYAISLTDASPKWIKPFEAKGAMVSTPLLSDGKIFIGSFDRTFYALDASSGRTLWQFEGDAWFWSDPVTNGKVVFAADMGGTLHALDAISGFQRWEFPKEGDTSIRLGSIIAAPLLLDEIIAVTSDSGYVHLVSTETGLQVGSYNVKAEVRASMATQDGTVYINTMDRKVSAWPSLGLQNQLWEVDTQEMVED